jgi:hypothetical protein
MSLTLSHVWKPSYARLVSIDSFIPVPRGNSVASPNPPIWPAKDPGDVLDYVLDIGPAVTGNDGDGIASVAVAIAPSDPGDVVAGSIVADGCRVILWLSGGQVGVVYTITFRVTTFNGRSLQRTVLLPVLPLSTPVIPSNALVTTTGTALTDQNGNPVISIT